MAFEGIKAGLEHLLVSSNAGVFYRKSSWLFCVARNIGPVHSRGEKSGRHSSLPIL